MPERLIRRIIEHQQILAAPARTTVSEAAQLMQSGHVGAMMVVDTHGHLAGIFTERDALFRVLAAGRDPATTKVSEVMTKKPQSIHPDKPVGHALHMMYENGFRHVPVVEGGRPIGMISARDALGPELNEFESDVQRRERIGEILG
jgi:signal-transduction protein with cAMP-binding, CBS, and nucleotidyltransferase domain